jgi:hypothetical protein
LLSALTFKACQVFFGWSLLATATSHYSFSFLLSSQK